MALKVIGAGWGGTGTESLKIALEQLGFEKCYHGFELIKDGARLKYWKQLHADSKTDFEMLFAGYEAAVDFPASLYYRELMKQYPEAKVILTIRDASEWYDSAINTIFKKPESVKLAILKLLGVFSKNISYVPQILDYIQILFQDVFHGQMEDKEAMIALFNKWNEQVINTVPADQLLIYKVQEGWDPLCDFLNVSMPATFFPSTNNKENFEQRVEKAILSPSQKREKSKK